MSEGRRIKRPPLDRDRPIRDRSGLFGAAAHDGRPVADSTARRVDSTDPIAQAVDTGYRVIEQYMRQGERVARQIGGQRTVDPARAVVSAQDRITEMTQMFSDMAGLWLELVQDVVQQGAARSTAGDAHNGGPPAASGNHGGASEPSPLSSAAVNLVLNSTLPVSGHVDLRPEYATAKLQVHDLRGTAADQPRITDVSFAPATDQTPARIVVRIPPDQPPGRYNAVLVEETGGRLAGTISVIIDGDGPPG